MCRVVSCRLMSCCGFFFLLLVRVHVSSRCAALCEVRRMKRVPVTSVRLIGEAARSGMS